MVAASWSISKMREAGMGSGAVAEKEEVRIADYYRWAKYTIGSRVHFFPCGRYNK